MSDTISTASLFERIGGRPKLVKFLQHFYADVRQQNEIGPIFAQHIEDWPSHIEKIADFWSGITGGPANYAGGMPYKHLHLGLEEKHFQAWLGLWRRNCQIHFKEPETSEMIEIAETIGRRLRFIVSSQGDRPFFQ